MNSITSMPGTAELFLQIPDCFVHRFTERTRTQISEGVCEIYESKIERENTNQKTYYLRVGDFFHILTKDQLIIKINYAGSVCFIIEGTKPQFYCVSFSKGCENLEKFEINMAHQLRIVDYSSELIDPSLRERLKTHCSQNIETEDISYDGKKTVRKIGNNVGFVAGRLNQIFNGPTVHNAVDALSQKANRFSEQKISDNAKSKWNTIKETSSTINDVLTVITSPIVSLVQSASESIGNSFYGSQNVVVKTIRDYSFALQQSLNQGQRKGHGLQTRREVSAINIR